MVKLREQSMQGLAPNQLGTYIKVSKPSVWFLVGIIVALLIAGIAWFFAGTITERVSTRMLVSADAATAYIPLSKASEVSVGDVVELADGNPGGSGTVRALGNEPVSLTTVRAQCGDATNKVMGADTWAVQLELDFDGAPGAYDASVITNTHRPIRLLLGLD